MGLHTSLLAGLLYTSVNRIMTPAAVEQPMSVMLMPAEPDESETPAPQEAPKKAATQTVVPDPAVSKSAVKPSTPQPEAKPQPVLVPEPPAPVQIAKPKPEIKHKPKPKPLRKMPEQTQPQPDQVAPAQTNPAASPAAPQERPTTVEPAVSSPALNSGPVAISRPDPIYPDRARVLGIEGRVQIQFDVNAGGQVENLQIISATPRNMFERQIREAVPRWRYQSGKPGKNLTMTVIFTLSGVSSSVD
jgi:protein TonB